MAKGRSPNYPAYSLEESLKLIEDVFKSERRNRMSRAVVASHLGYAGLSGRALTKIGTLRSYGLLEGAGDEMRVSEDALIILNAPSNSRDRHEALKRCALNPNLFGDIYKSFPGRPSPENLKYKLIRMDFTPEAAPVAIKAFFETMEFARVWEDDEDNFASVDSGELKSRPAAQVRETPDSGSEASEDLADVSAGVRSRREVFGLDEGDVVIIYPEKISASSLEDLEDYLALFLKKLKRRNTQE